MTKKKPSRVYLKTHVETNTATADGRQREAWICFGRALQGLQEEIRDKAKELAGLRKRFKRLNGELIAAATEERLPLFEANGKQR